MWVILTSVRTALRVGRNSHRRGTTNHGGLIMTLNNIQNVVAAYFDKAAADLTVGSENLFLAAANEARKDAELLHNFEFSRIVAVLTIDGNNGGKLADAQIVGGNDLWNGIKEITALRRLRPNGTYIPLDFTRADIPIERERTELEFSDNLWPTNRYPSDADLLARGTASSMIQRGRTLYIYPGFTETASDTSVDVTIEGFGWLKDYIVVDPDAPEPEDFIVDKGSSYLKWAIICDLNTTFQKFVPRQEGNLPPPEKQRDAAFQRLLLWDSYQVDSNITRSR